MIMFCSRGCPGEISLSQGKGAKGLILRYGERSLVSKRFIIASTLVELLVNCPVSGSQMEERLEGVVSLWCVCRAEEVFCLDLCASLGFLINMFRRADP